MNNLRQTWCLVGYPFNPKIGNNSRHAKASSDFNVHVTVEDEMEKVWEEVIEGS